MKNRGISIFLVVVTVVIVGVVAIDYVAKRPDQPTPNPYEYSVDPFARIDSAMIMFKEKRDLAIAFNEPKALAIDREELFVVGDQKLQVIEPSGKLIREVALDASPTAVYAQGDSVWIGFKKYIVLYSRSGKELWRGVPFSDSTVVTSMVRLGQYLYVADAGKRVIRKLTTDGKEVSLIEGKSSANQTHGFIIPSPYFDMAVNGDGELWVVNPGRHALENYTPSGELRTWWQATSIKVEGFSGCCNPAHFAFLPDGSFVTSEKGMIRIKTYKPSGQFEGVVAPPSKFVSDGHAPDLAVGGDGTIYALDADRRMLRLFVRK